jgi:hypothetical protein
MNPDGIAYLDMGEAYLEGDWPAAINGYWSPLYAWLLAVGMRIFDPPMALVFPTVHLVNLAIYLVALGCFGFFWGQLTRYHRWRSKEQGDLCLPRWMWLSLGYVLFVWSSLGLIEIWSVTPDMILSAWIYLAAGLILCIRVHRATWRTWGMLGAVLGLGYLSKAIMFPLSVVFLAAAWLSAGNRRRAMPLVLMSSVCFIVLASPFAVALSLAKGRPTFGDSGKLNYARYVNGLPDAHWQGEIANSGTPVHPTRRILQAPAVYEFATPVLGTYPPWYDPSYWYEGVILRFDLVAQISVLAESVLFYYELFFLQQGSLIVGMLTLYLMSRRRAFRFGEILRWWSLLLPVLIALAMYAVVYVEARYLGPFVVLLWADLLANVRIHNSPRSARLAAILSVVILLLMLANIAALNFEGLRAFAGWGRPSRSAISQPKPPAWPGEVAQALHELGIAPGDKVAIIGYGFDSFWAKLARVQIVAEMPGTEASLFWFGDASTRAEALRAFASAGAEAIVAESVPPAVSVVGWERVGQSGYHILLLGEQVDATTGAIARVPR